MFGIEVAPAPSPTLHIPGYNGFCVAGQDLYVEEGVHASKVHPRWTRVERGYPCKAWQIWETFSHSVCNVCLCMYAMSF